ncbi:MAG: hypothetical protein HY928_04235 [Elusimicrobia bacterium]|nr:hypothetical protein [Elusimicrobiota bacterium]
MNAVLLALLSLAAAAGLYFGMERWGGPELRGWAAPGAAALAAGGVGQALGLPSWATVGAFLGAMFIFHKKARQRLAAEAEAVGKLAVPEAGWLLEPLPSPGGACIASWSCRDGADPDPVVFALEYEGEKEEEAKTFLLARATRFRAGVLVAHRPGSDGEAARLLSERESVSELTGQTDSVVIRCVPPDFAFAVLDIKTLGALQELIGLSRPERSLYLHVNGPELRVVCEGMPGREDIRAMLTRAAVVAARLRFLGRQQPAT